MEVVSSTLRRLGLALLLGLVASAGLPQAHPAPEVEADRLQAAVVSIWVDGSCEGTGFLVSPEGHLITAAHVVQDATEVEVRLPGEEERLPVELHKLEFEPEEGKDFALLKIKVEGGGGGEDGFPWLKLGNSDKVAQGDKVKAIGFPSPLERGCEQPAETEGRVITPRKAQAIPYPRLGEQTLTDLIETDVEVWQGSSGGPLFKGDEVVGIIVGGFAFPRFAYAIPINLAVKSLLPPAARILPPYPPEIVRIEPPERIMADGSPYPGRIRFRDLNGDVHMVFFKIEEAQDPTQFQILDLEGNPACSEGECFLFLEGYRESKSIEGELEIPFIATAPQRVTLKVKLFDLRGRKSEPAERLSLTVRVPNRPPAITGIEFAEVIPADGQEHTGRVSFRDEDGNVLAALFVAVEAADLTSFSLDPKVLGQTEGSFEFALATTTPQSATFKVMLVDSEGAVSEPVEFSFRAE